MWANNRITKLLGIELPIIQAPMAGSVLSQMVMAVSEAGGLGSLPCATLSADQIRNEYKLIRQRTAKPVNLNFFCHKSPAESQEQERAWKKQLERYYVELGIDPQTPLPAARRQPFDAQLCELVEELRPEVVSFHFGLPASDLLTRVKAIGATVLSSATTVEEARWLEAQGCDAIIAQGAEAGGHRGMFLSQDIATQVGTMALVPQVVDAVKVPVIAAGGIADARGIVAALALGASAVQLGTAYLFCPEAEIAPRYRAALQQANDNNTVITNVFTGRPARGLVNRLVREIGPMSEVAPEFPLASGALAPLQPGNSTDFIPLWSGQAARLSRELPAGELTRFLADETARRIANFQELG